MEHLVTQKRYEALIEKQKSEGKGKKASSKKLERKTF